MSNSLSAILFAAILAAVSIKSFACTIAVIGGGVTSDGRPLLWKNRDVNTVNQGFRYFPARQSPGHSTHGYIGNYYSNDTTRIFMGINDAGFGVVNSNTYNLADEQLANGDGILMRIALETCTKITEFQRLLDSTNTTSRDNEYNFGVIEAQGGAAMYECSRNHYVKYSVDHEQNQIIIRTNSSKSGIRDYANDFRRNRADTLINLALNNDAIVPGGLNAKYILHHCVRDLANIYANPYPFPYNGRQRSNQAGYIFTDSAITICNRRTTSAVVIRGVLPNEDPRFSAMFAILGQPEQSIAFPLWVGAENVPIFLNQDSIPPVLNITLGRRNMLFSGSPNFMNSHYLYMNNNIGIYNYIYPLEQWGVQMADSMQNVWRSCPPSQTEIWVFEMRLSRRLFYGLLNQTAQGIFRDR